MYKSLTFEVNPIQDDHQSQVAFRNTKTTVTQPNDYILSQKKITQNFCLKLKIPSRNVRTLNLRKL